MRPGNLVTIVTKRCNSYNGSLFRIESILPGKFTYRALFDSYSKEPDKEVDEFNLNYKDNASWEREATITAADNFYQSKGNLVFSNFKRVNVKFKEGANSASRARYKDVPLLAENETHFQVYGYHHWDDSRVKRLIVLAKRDYTYTVLQKPQKTYI
jgi:hypothetical protein